MSAAKRNERRRARIKELRDAGLSGREISEKLKISQGTVWYYLRGKKHNRTVLSGTSPGVREIASSEREATPSFAIDLTRLQHMCDNTWSGLNIAEKVMALSSLTFDPSNPNDD